MVMFMKSLFRLSHLFTITFLCLISSGCPSIFQSEQEEILTINEKSVTLEQLNSRYNTFFAQFGSLVSPAMMLDSASLRILFLNGVIVDTLLLQEIKKRGVHVDQKEVDQRVKQMLSQASPGFLRIAFAKSSINFEKWLTTIKLRMLAERLTQSYGVPGKYTDLLSAKQHYDDNIDQFLQAEKWEASQILVETAEDATVVLQKLAAGDSFQVMAQEYSIAPERNRFGKMGVFRAGELPAELERSLRGLQEKQISKIVKTEHGYHIIRLDRKIDARVFRFQEVSSEIITSLMEKRRNTAMRALLRKMEQEAEIKIDWENFYYFLLMKQQINDHQ